ncbi:MAG: hypothetical protein GX879_00510 [Bacteroidales bacterium]|nr:hypothetical protein [Bacteroidales bacterium]
MNIKKITLLLSLSLLAASISFSQVKNGVQDKLERLYEDGRYEDCAFRAERMLFKGKHKGDPEILLYVAMSYNKIYMLSKIDETVVEKEPDYAKAYDQALRFAIDAKKRDRRNEEIFPDNNDVLEEIVYNGLPIADLYITEKRYTKASALYRKFLRLVNNQHIEFIKAVLDLYSLDKVAANEVFEKFFPALQENKLEKNHDTEYLMQKGFVLYHDFLIEEDSIYFADSAKFILRQGLRLFPDDYEMTQRLFPPKDEEK